MTNELRKTGGVGMNVRYDVYRDGRPVGEIHRHGQAAVRISGHYGELLVSCGSFAEAKTKAESLPFPSKAELYERVCVRVEASRALSLERHCGPKLAALSRDLLMGSVSAMEELGSLLNAMENLAKDREHSTRKAENARSPAWKTEFLLGEAVKWDQHLDCEFPAPPEA
jgi:hypothetical protein|nr:hypothetical protein [Neorhizobium tomejilense]